jgi:hypothetical protein
MKRTIYGLLTIASIIASEANASDKAPQRPTTKPGEWKTDNSICPDQMDMKQLRELENGPITLNGHQFKVSTSLDTFKNMLPSKARVISSNTSIAKILEPGGAAPRAVIGGVDGRHLVCTYTFRTATGSKMGKTPTKFSIISVEGKDVLSEPKGLTEAIMNTETTQAR